MLLLHYHREATACACTICLTENAVRYGGRPAGKIAEEFRSRCVGGNDDVAREWQAQLCSCCSHGTKTSIITDKLMLSMQCTVLIQQHHSNFSPKMIDLPRSGCDLCCSCHSLMTQCNVIKPMMTRTYHKQSINRLPKGQS